MRISIKQFVVAALILLSAVSLPARELPPSADDGGASFCVKGSFKELITRIPVDSYSLTGKERYFNASLSRLRLSPEFISDDGMLILHADCDNELLVSGYPRTYEFYSIWQEQTYNDIAPLSKSFERNDVYNQMGIHQAFAKLSAGSFIFTAGRQQIPFGSGRLWNPLDIFSAPSPFSAESAEEQKGTDALRAEYYPGETTEFSIILNPMRKEDTLPGRSGYENTNALLRAKSTFSNTETAASAGYVARRYLGGADISTLLFDGFLRGS
ncbi:MAG: hypothetical protein ACRCUT_13925, partial [Spirochaetota bacterium]